MKMILLSFISCHTSARSSILVLIKGKYPKTGKSVLSANSLDTLMDSWIDGRVAPTFSLPTRDFLLHPDVYRK